MSGFVENKIEPLIQKLLIKIWKGFTIKGEVSLAANHFWHMLAITMSLNCIGHPVSYLLSILSVSLIAIAEWPPEGRCIDVFTRGAGWLLGAITGVYFLCR